MPDPQTPNLGLYIPLRGADVGIWDVPANANATALDNALGAAVDVPVASGTLSLSPAQYACAFINFSGTLTGDVTVTFPAVGRFYYVSTNATGTGTYIIKMNVGGATEICVPPGGDPVAIMTTATGIRFMNLPIVGTYIDMGISSVPRWISNCTTQPYLNCDGSAFSSTTYPVLAAYLGGTTLPDLRGRGRMALNQGTGRVTGAVNGNTLLASGGSQFISQANLPSYTLPDTVSFGVTDPGHTHGGTTNLENAAHNHTGTTDSGGVDHTHNYSITTQGALGAAGGFGNFANAPSGTNTGTASAYLHQHTFTTGTESANHAHAFTSNSNTTGISLSRNGTVTSGGSGSGYAMPTTIHGLTLIRAG